MLDFDQSIPDGVTNGAPLIVLLHGRGSHKGDLMGLRPALPAGAMVVTPQAPFPGAPWGYGDGWAWYRFLGGKTPEPRSFEAGQAALHEFLTALPESLPVQPGPVILGGFSQGSTSSLAYALCNPGSLAGLMMFSGFVADHPSVHVTPETASGLRLYWGHGTLDQMIPFQHGEEGRRALAAAGAEVTTGNYPIGHWIDEGELADAVTWLDSVLRSESSAGPDADVRS